jgi:hypothetical protein
LKPIKAILIFIALCFVCYVLCVLIVLAVLYFFFREVTPSLEMVLVVFGMLIPVGTIVLAVIGTMLIMKRDKKRILMSEEKTDNEKEA